MTESDSRIQQIHHLWKQLDDHSSTSLKLADKAELLVTLYELEGVATRMHEAYYRASLEWNGVGEPVKAVRYARLCLSKGLVLKGPDRPFVKEMQALVSDPGKHWSWRFRLEGGRKPGN